MASLNDMIGYGVIKVGDTIEFTFKSNKFCAKILRGGLIGQCKLKGAHERDYIAILEKTVAFSSLTAWTEACLQDIMDEYYTRYSSWKRVTHRESKRSMGDIRDQCKLMEPSRQKQDDTVELYKEILRLHVAIGEMNTYIKRIHNGERLPYKEWSFLQVNALEKPPTIATVTHPIDHVAHNRIQNMICKNNGVVDYLASSHT
jgi:hypothetical protein